MPTMTKSAVRMTDKPITGQAAASAGDREEF